jgi:hypothetical protein
MADTEYVCQFCDRKYRESEMSDWVPLPSRVSHHSDIRLDKRNLIVHDLVEVEEKSAD